MEQQVKCRIAERLFIRICIIDRILSEGRFLTSMNAIEVNTERTNLTACSVPGLGLLSFCSFLRANLQIRSDSLILIGLGRFDLQRTMAAQCLFASTSSDHPFQNFSGILKILAALWLFHGRSCLFMRR